MDHNRRGLALMLSVFLISILVASIRSCNDTAVQRLSQLDIANQKLIHDAPGLTSPLRDYRITAIENGEMVVDLGPSVTLEQARTLARRLTLLLHDHDAPFLHSDLVLVHLDRNGKRVCDGQMSSEGVWVGTPGRGGWSWIIASLALLAGAGIWAFRRKPAVVKSEQQIES